jgi:hypothetical protein
MVAPPTIAHDVARVAPSVSDAATMVTTTPNTTDVTARLKSSFRTSVSSEVRHDATPTRTGHAKCFAGGRDIAPATNPQGPPSSVPRPAVWRT